MGLPIKIEEGQKKNNHPTLQIKSYFLFWLLPNLNILWESIFLYLET